MGDRDRVKKGKGKKKVKMKEEEVVATKFEEVEEVLIVTTWRLRLFVGEDREDMSLLMRDNSLMCYLQSYMVYKIPENSWWTAKMVAKNCILVNILDRRHVMLVDHMRKTFEPFRPFEHSDFFMWACVAKREMNFMIISGKDENLAFRMEEWMEVIEYDKKITKRDMVLCQKRIEDTEKLIKASVVPMFYNPPQHMKYMMWKSVWEQQLASHVRKLNHLLTFIPDYPMVLDRVHYDNYPTW